MELTTPRSLAPPGPKQTVTTFLLPCQPSATFHDQTYVAEFHKSMKCCMPDGETEKSHSDFALRGTAVPKERIEMSVFYPRES